MTDDTLAYCEADNCDKKDKVPVYFYANRYWCEDCLRSELAQVINGRMTRELKEIAMEIIPGSLKSIFNTVDKRKQTEIMKIVLQNMILPPEKQLNLELKNHRVYGRIKLCWFVRDQFVSKEDLETYLYLKRNNCPLPYEIKWMEDESA